MTIVKWHLNVTGCIFSIRSTGELLKLFELPSAFKNFIVPLELDLSSIRLTTTQFCRVLEILKENPIIKSLNVAGNILDDAAFRVLANETKHLPNLSRINLEYNQVTDAGVRFFRKSIAQGTHLNSVELRGNLASPREIALLEKSISNFSSTNVYTVKGFKLLEKTEPIVSEQRSFLSRIISTPDSIGVKRL